MAWAPYQFGSYTHWADQPLSDAWFRYAQGLAQQLTRPALQGMTYAAQRAAIVAVWVAMSNGFRAANLCPLAVESYRNAQLAWVGPVSTISPLDFSNGQVGAIEGGWPGDGGTMGTRIRAAYRLAGNTIAASDPLCHMQVRLSLGSDGIPKSNCLGGNTDPGVCNNTGMWSGCLVDGSPTNDTNCDPYSAFTVSWSDTPAFGIAAGTTCKITQCLPALAWSNEFALAVLGQVIALGVPTLVTNAVGFAAAVDIQNANLLGLTTQQWQNGVANIPTSAAAVQWSHNFAQQAGFGQVILNAAGAIPVIGTFLTLVVNLFEQLAPMAVGVSIDPFGLAVPSNKTPSSFLVPFIVPSRPTYVVPSPPSYVPPLPTTPPLPLAVRVPTIGSGGSRIGATAQIGQAASAPMVFTPDVNPLTGPAPAGWVGGAPPSNVTPPSQANGNGSSSDASTFPASSVVAQPQGTPAPATAPATTAGASGTAIAVAVVATSVAAAGFAVWLKMQGARRR